MVEADAENNIEELERSISKLDQDMSVALDLLEDPELGSVERIKLEAHIEGMKAKSERLIENRGENPRL